MLSVFRRRRWRRRQRGDYGGIENVAIARKLRGGNPALGAIEQADGDPHTELIAPDHKDANARLDNTYYVEFRAWPGAQIGVVAKLHLDGLTGGAAGRRWPGSCSF